ncbi:MAG TPA: hypothetical protein DEA91_22250 [Paenibacillus sp.]|nr:hypothetical protein [Paenibacillus sp.]
MKNINKSLRKVDKSFVKLNSKPFTKKDQLDMMNDVSDTMSEINKAIKSIERSELTSSQKREKIEPLTKQRNELAKRSNDFFGVSK